MTALDLATTTHRRFDPLTGRWILVSPHRSKRPWQGQREVVSMPAVPPHDPDCHLCPGNERSSGDLNPDYTGTWWFQNDFAALSPDHHHGADAVMNDGLLVATAVQGTCRVLCFSPRHDLTLARATPAELRAVIELWSEQYSELASRWRYVQVFENRGEAMGASSPHPHGQLWATSVLPRRVATEDERQLAHHAETGGNLLLEVVAQEMERAERVVIASDHWVVAVPFWATWPFETLVVPRRHVRRFIELDDVERDDLAAVLKELLVRYDNLFDVSFPYSMGWHGAPGATGEASLGDDDHWQLHAHFYPPLLRSATVRKFMVGYELLAEEQRDITPEHAADRLRSVADVHYLDAAADHATSCSGE